MIDSAVRLRKHEKSSRSTVDLRNAATASVPELRNEFHRVIMLTHIDKRGEQQQFRYSIYRISISNFTSSHEDGAREGIKTHTEKYHRTNGRQH